jgi:hypothetical protein
MENPMAQAQAAAAFDDAGNESSRPFSKKAPAVLYDNGHGTKVKRWDDGISNIQIEHSYKPKDSDQYVTHTINVTPEEALGIVFGLQKAVEQSMEIKAQNRTR